MTPAQQYIVREMCTYPNLDSQAKRQYQHLLKMTQRPILIGGCGRSGTSILSSILSCHPQIASVSGETYAFCRSGYNNSIKPNARPQPGQLFNALLRADLPEKIVSWCEKSPKNILLVSQILRYLGPDARFIHIVRDGRDVVTSKRPSRPGASWVSPKRWVKDVSAGLKHEDNPQLMTIRYEDLAHNYASTLQKLCKFINLPYATEFNAFPQSINPVPYRGYKSLDLRPMDTSSIGRWKQPEHTKTSKAITNFPGAQQLLEHYGYIEQ